MTHPERKIEIVIGLNELKKGTATQAFCKVCERPVDKLPHVHDLKVKINPSRRGM